MTGIMLDGLEIEAIAEQGSQVCAPEAMQRELPAFLGRGLAAIATVAVETSTTGQPLQYPQQVLVGLVVLGAHDQHGVGVRLSPCFQPAQQLIRYGDVSLFAVLREV